MMTTEQFREYEQQKGKNISNDELSTIEVLLDESERAIQEGNVLTKEQTFALLKNSYEF